MNIELKAATDFPASPHHFAVLIQYDQNRDQSHCGMLYATQNRNSQFLHLAWHHDLRKNNNLQKLNKYAWVAPKIHELRAKQVPYMCNRVFQRHAEKEIPYGIVYEGGKFLKNGELALKENEYGLTCATFVLAVFEACYINLFNYDEWPAREEDAIFHEAILRALESSNANKDHIAHVKKSIGCARYKPEEVAIGSSQKKLPAKYKKIMKLSKSLIEALEEKNLSA